MNPKLNKQQRKYPGTKAFKCLAIEGAGPVLKKVWQMDEKRGVMVEKLVAA